MEQKRTQERITVLENIQWKWVAAVIPYYCRGNHTACQVHYKDGKYEVVHASIRRTMDSWMRYYGNNLEDVKELSEQLADGKRRISLIYGGGRCAVAVKSREKQGSSGTLGYIDLDSIEYVVEIDGYGTMVFFHEAHKGIRIPQKKVTVDLQIQRGREMQKRYILAQKEQKEKEDRLLAESRKKKKKTNHSRLDMEEYLEE